MRLNNNAAKSYETNKTALNSHNFEIGDQSIIIEILRNKLYSNPIQTLVQEYVSNARDANREAKSSRPIEISLPIDSLTLSIRDFGPGLSPERVREVFTKYGNSTKRNSDSQVGGFGIGAKSAWAYTDAFSIISYYNGTVRHYIAHVSKDSKGSLDLISETATNEPNGVEIQIAVKKDDAEDFIDAVDRATKYWELNEYPKVDLSRETTIDRLGNFESVPRNNEEGLKIVVDGIPYPMPERFEENRDINNLSRKLNCLGLLHFKSNEIEVAASREAITNNDKNLQAVANAAKDAVKAINKHIQSEMKSCKTLREALDKHIELSDTYVHDQNYNLKFNNDNFELYESGELVSDLFKNLSIEKYYVRSRYGRREGKMRIETVHNADFRSGHWFYTDDLTSRANQSRRVRALAENDTVYILQCEDINNPNLKTLAAHLNIPGTSSLGPASTRKTVSKTAQDDVLINVYASPGSRATTSKLVNLGRNRTQYVYAVNESEDTKGNFKQINAVLDSCGLSFCIVSKSTANKIANDSKFTSFDQFLKDYRSMISPESFEKLLNTFKHMILYSKEYGDNHHFEVYAALAKVGVQDPKLDHALKVISKLDSVNQLKDNNNENLTSYHSVNLSLHDEIVNKFMKAIPEVQDYEREEKVMSDMRETYVLLQGIRDEKYNDKDSAPHLALYINSLYAVTGGAK